MPSTRTLALALLRRSLAGEPPTGFILRAIGGPLDGWILHLGAAETLGRGRAATLAIPDPAVSRRHARLEVGRGGLRVVDLGSKNGLRVNGRRASGARALRPGDRLALGETALVVETSGAAPGAPAEPAAAGRGRARHLAAGAGLLIAALLAALALS